ncbi:MAG: hypothetical protein LRZ93_01335 [Clostridiales bacterium]|nr:hypothetical protein [Clostridiales bacterium]
MYKFIETFRGIYGVFIMSVVIIIGIILICVEIPRLAKTQLIKEIMVAKVIATTYSSWDYYIHIASNNLIVKWAHIKAILKGEK